MASQYQSNSIPFSTLNDQLHEFRLLTLYPGKQDVPIECSLSYLSLNQQIPPYEALSSTPGQSSPDWKIGVNGHEFGVTEHIAAALRALRYQAKTRILWVECICVNRQDLNERSAQLQLKTHIFARAENVIVWLGPGTIKTHETFRYIDRHIEATKSPFANGVDWEDVYGQSIITNMIDEILSRKWWSWTQAVPEVVVATNVIIKCGSSVVTWQDFVDLIRYLRTRNFQFQTILNNKYIDSIDLIKSTYISGRHQGLSQLLLRLCHFESTDSRDKILAAFAVRQRNTPLPSYIGYSKSSLELQLNVVDTSILGDLSLDFLSLAGLETSHSTKSSWSPDLQQSQPAWRTPGILTKSSYSHLIEPTMINSASPFCAADTTSPAVIVSMVGGKQSLTASGILVDDVEIIPTSSLGRSTPSLLKTWEIVLSYAFGTMEAFKSLTDRWEARMVPRVLNPESKKAKYVECLVDGNPEHCELRREIFRKARDKLLQAIPHYNLRISRPHYPTPRALQDAYYRTVLTDRTASRERVSKEYITACMMNLESGDPTNAATLATVLPHVPVGNRKAVFQQDFLTALESSLQFRTLFVTATGYIGLGPLTMLPNDIVCVLLGCSVPVVLRRLNPSSHVLIGECYVHGIMNGEMIVQGWERNVQTFTIV